MNKRFDRKKEKKKEREREREIVCVCVCALLELLDSFFFFFFFFFVVVVVVAFSSLLLRKIFDLKWKFSTTEISLIQRELETEIEAIFPFLSSFFDEEEEEEGDKILETSLNS